MASDGKAHRAVDRHKDYKAGVGCLTNPLNDIRIVGDALKSVGFEVLKPVAAGSFTMGSPASEPARLVEPQHEVTIRKPFAVGRFAITRGEFEAFVRVTNRTIGDDCWNNVFKGGWMLAILRRHEHFGR